MGQPARAPQGIGIRLLPEADAAEFQHRVNLLVQGLVPPHWCKSEVLDTPDGRMLRLRLRKSVFAKLAEGFDTLDLRERLSKSSAPGDEDLLQLETWVALLCAPVRIDFPTIDDLQSHLRIRRNIALAAEKTALAFKTHAAERPTAFWRDDPDVGFLLQPGASLVDALVAATQPERTGALYDFSCYRATEYVILLGIAQEARESDPALYEALERTARVHCIKSGRFHEVFLTEYGTADAPIPPRYYVPGDRVWFKNPDPVSSNASGYEGSWVIYMGGGRFSNFWKRDAPYTFRAKLLEVYHWRDGAYADGSDVQMDETVVEAAMARTRADAPRHRRILSRMARYRDPMGVYADGACIVSSREFPRHLRDIRMP